MCVVYSKCQCCSSVGGEWDEITVQCFLALPEGTMHEERTLFIWKITQCECQECNGSYITIYFTHKPICVLYWYDTKQSVWVVDDPWPDDPLKQRPMTRCTFCDSARPETCAELTKQRDTENVKKLADFVHQYSSWFRTDRCHSQRKAFRYKSSTIKPH